ncbi:AAA family ATPase [Streptomyces sp. NPDC007325]|uniref:helix-turn-helix transcriptional regulator n=1 Tax=Streptomyces sp. NPDC007325 TaxID=3154588 RepID=UPI00340424A4
MSTNPGRHPEDDGTIGRFPFVGRDRELDRVLRALARPPAVVIIEGEAGAGKTRLIAEATAALTARGRRVLTGTCHPLREPLPYGPVLDALRGLTGPLPAADTMDPAAAHLAPYLPNLASALPAPSGAAPRGRLRRFRLVQAVRALLAALGPVVVVVDDTHWADPATRELLLILARDPVPGLGLVIACRSEELRRSGAPVLGAEYRRPLGVDGVDLTLAPLAESDVRGLAADVLGPDAARALGDTLFERSAGLPLVVEEDLITLSEQARSEGTQGTERYAAALERQGVPRSLREAVEARVGQLSPQAVAVTEAAAVLAVPAEESLLAEVAALEPETAARALLDALDAAVLIEVGTAPTRYGLRHALARRAVYESVQGPRRQRLHRQAVRALERLPSPPLVQIAHHTRALGDRAGWLVQAQAAAEQALELGDQGIATEMLQDVLADSALDDAGRARAAWTLSRLASHSVDYRPALASLRRTVSDTRLPVPVRGQVRLTLGLLLMNQAGDLRNGRREAELAVRELASIPELAACGMAALSMPGSDCPFAEDLAWIERAERTAADSADDAVRSILRASRITLQAVAADPAVWDRVAELPRHAEHPEIARQSARAMVATGYLMGHMGHDRRAAALLDECLGLARESGSPLMTAQCKAYLLQYAWWRGEWEGLEERIDALRGEVQGAPVAQRELVLLSSRLAAARGRRAEAMEGFDAFTEHEEQAGWQLMWWQGAVGLARLRLSGGDPAGAWEALAPALDAYGRKGVWTVAAGLVPLAVEIALALGREDTARQVADALERGAGGTDALEWGSGHADAPAARAELLLTRGLLLRGDDPAGAATAFEAARGVYEEIGRPYEALLAAERAACSGPDSADRSAGALTAVAEAFAALGAESDAERCRKALRDLGFGRPSTRGRRGYGDRLSPRETQIARLVAGGATNKDIAQALFLSPRTVEHHVASALRKLKVADRDEVGAALRVLDDGEAATP